MYSVLRAVFRDTIAAMRWLILPVMLLSAAVGFFAQTAPPNATGISAGHIHIVVPDPAAYQKTIISVLGGEAVNAGPLTMVKLPGIFFIMTATRGGAGPTGGSKGSTADHMGFSVKSFAATKAKADAAGLPVQVLTKDVQAFVTFPNDVIVEIQEDTALKTDTAFSHFHLSVPDTAASLAWYLKTFGGTEASRRPGMKGAGVPGGIVDFLAAKGAPPAPTKGRFLDHIGFEVKDLDSFAKTLTDAGMKMDMNPTDMTKQFGLKIAFITDPNGQYIELTQGLSAK